VLRQFYNLQFNKHIFELKAVPTWFLVHKILFCGQRHGA